MFTCPACEQPINPASEVCPYCRADLAPAAPAQRRVAQRRGLLFMLLGGAALLASIWAIVMFVLPRPDVPPPAEAEAVAIHSLREMAGILSRYEREGGGYPLSIQQVSAQAGSIYSEAHDEGYFLRYQAGKPGADGSVHAYELLARPAYYGYRNFYVDQTGVIRATNQNRPATKKDPPIS